MPLSEIDSNLIDKALQSISTSLPVGRRVIVGISGGVDSSVSMALLKELGYDVVGLFMKNWEDDDPESSKCTSEQDFQDAALSAKILNVPYFSVNFTKEYREEVFDQFIDGLKAFNSNCICLQSAIAG